MSDPTEGKLERFINVVTRPMDPVSTWPRWMRIAYLILFPIAMPLHEITRFVILGLALAAAAICACILLAYEVWTGKPNEWSAP